MIAIARDLLSRSWLVARLPLAALLLSGCFETLEPRQVGGCDPDIECVPTPTAVVGGHQFTSLAAGQHHTCGLKANGEVWCWGLNTAGQLGAETADLISGTPVRVGGQEIFTSITAGDFHTCGLASDSGVYCWGTNLTLVLGVETVSDQCSGRPCSYSPVRAGGSTFTATAVDAGATHNCALDSAGAAWCWGFNYLAEIGNLTLQEGFFTPQPVQGGPFSSLTSGYRFNCGLDAAGSAFCWGAGEDGQLGNLEIEPCVTPVNPLCSAEPLPVNTTVVFGAATSGVGFVCARASDASLHCWGRNSEGQLGNGGTVPSAVPVPVQAAGGAAWSSVVAGYFHACAVRPNGAAFCWGANNNAQLGDGTTVFASSTPQPVQGGRTFEQLVAGSDHTCGLTADGAAWCWGNNQLKQIGTG